MKFPIPSCYLTFASLPISHISTITKSMLDIYLITLIGKGDEEGLQNNGLGSEDSASAFRGGIFFLNVKD